MAFYDFQVIFSSDESNMLRQYFVYCRNMLGEVWRKNAGKRQAAFDSRTIY